MKSNRSDIFWMFIQDQENVKQEVKQNQQAQLIKPTWKN